MHGGKKEDRKGKRNEKRREGKDTGAAGTMEEAEPQDLSGKNIIFNRGQIISYPLLTEAISKRSVPTHALADKGIETQEIVCLENDSIWI